MVLVALVADDNEVLSVSEACAEVDSASSTALSSDTPSSDLTFNASGVVDRLWNSGADTSDSLET